MEVSNSTTKEKEKEESAGVSSIVSELLSDYDSTAKLTLTSQNHLSSALNRLTRELDQLLEDAPLPFAVQYGAKISNVRKRVWSLNSLLKSIQQRLDNMDRMLSHSQAHAHSHEKGAVSECSEDA